MRRDIAERIAASRDYFMMTVWPVIQHRYGGGTMTAIEGDPRPRFRELDMNFGIDMMQITEKGVRQTWASRVQWVDQNKYETFTVRYQKLNGRLSDWHKYLEHIQAKALFPAWMCHAYASKRTNRLLSVGVVPTEQAMRWMDQRPVDWWRSGYQKVNSEDGTVFRAVAWRHLRHDGVDVQWWGRKDIANIQDEQQLRLL